MYTKIANLLMVLPKYIYFFNYAMYECIIIQMYIFLTGGSALHLQVISSLIVEITNEVSVRC